VARRRQRCVPCLNRPAPLFSVPVEAIVKLDQNPVFRKIIVPWYDSTPICMLAIAAMLAIALFGGAGVVIALEEPAFGNAWWVPLMIVLLSLLVAALVGRRLVLRLLHHRMSE